MHLNPFSPFDICIQNPKISFTIPDKAFGTRLTTIFIIDTPFTTCTDIDILL